MSSATKTLELLSYFSVTRPEIGLSQLSRIARRDKATTHRHLQVLEELGFVEQHPVSKSYRLGPVVLQLAQTREISVPRKAGAEMALSVLADAIGETTHVSVLSGKVLYPLTSCESHKHSARVIIDNQISPLHATASGLCVLAFGPAELFDVAVSNMEVFTSNTVTTPEELKETVQKVRQTGFAHTNRSFEPEVSSVAAPVFDQTGLIAGAVSVACVATRFTPALESEIRKHLVTASLTITRNWGGNVPETIVSNWTDNTGESDTGH